MDTTAIIKNYKKGVDVLALPNELDKIYYSTFNPQHECLFEIILLPENFLSSLKVAPLTTLMDPVVTRFHLYDIDIPLLGFEYERYNGKREIVNIVYPDEVSCTFLETSSGVVKGYLRKWQSEIGVYNPLTKEYNFQDDQTGSKKKVYIFPYGKDIFPTLEYIEITGLKFQSMDPLHFGHDSGEIEKIKVTFSCDNAQIVGVL